LKTIEKKGNLRGEVVMVRSIQGERSSEFGKRAGANSAWTMVPQKDSTKEKKVACHISYNLEQKQHGNNRGKNQGGVKGMVGVLSLKKF